MADPRITVIPLCWESDGPRKASARDPVDESIWMLSEKDGRTTGKHLSSGKGGLISTIGVDMPIADLAQMIDRLRASRILSQVRSDASANRVTYGDDGLLDEVVTDGVAHLENLGDGSWMLHMTRADGSSIHITLWGRVAIVGEWPS